ncbi:C4-dicarboxylate ABC transporter permease [Treponema sp. R8-4-B8]
MSGYFSGILSLIEVSAVSVIYVIIVEVFIKKDILFKDIPKVFLKAVPIIGGILAILAMAKALSYSFIDSGIPESFSLWMQSAVQSKYVFLLLLNLALLVLGCIMDIFSAILVFLPLIVPLGYAYGIDPVHLGIIFIVNLEAGFLTPPVGMNLFLASYRFDKPFMQICSYVSPFLLVRLVVVLLVTYLPWLSTWLVKLF